MKKSDSKIISYLTENSKRTVDADRAVKLTNGTKNSMYLKLSRMCSDGQLQRVKSGVYTLPGTVGTQSKAVVKVIKSVPKVAKQKNDDVTKFMLNARKDNFLKQKEEHLKKIEIIEKNIESLDKVIKLI